MSVISAALKHMLAAGMAPDAIVQAVADMEAEMRLNVANDAAPSTGALRQRRYRERHKASQNVTSDDGDGVVTVVTGGDVPPPLSPSPLSSPQTPKQTPHPHTPPRDTRTREARFPIPEGVTAEQWQGFTRQRKKPLNQRAYELLTGKLLDLDRDGYPPGEMIDLATLRGWETVFKPKDDHNGYRQPALQPANQLRGSRPDPALDMWRQAIEDERAEQYQADHSGSRLALPPH